MLSALVREASGEISPAQRPATLRAVALPGVKLRAGHFTTDSASAVVARGMLAGVPVLLVAFGGSNSRAAWINNLRDIDATYAQFLPLVRAVDAYAAAGGDVVLAGHSLGGALVQLFMYGHRANDHYRAITWGSPGALPKPGVFAPQRDLRIVNYAISDDPFVFLGEHRAQVTAHARRHPAYGVTLALVIARESGLSVAQVVRSMPRRPSDYVNNGVQVVLLGRRRRLTIPSVILADPAEHDMDTYMALLASRHAPALPRP